MERRDTQQDKLKRALFVALVEKKYRLTENDTLLHSWGGGTTATALITVYFLIMSVGKHPPAIESAGRPLKYRMAQIE